MTPEQANPAFALYLQLDPEAWGSFSNLLGSPGGPFMPSQGGSRGPPHESDLRARIHPVVRWFGNEPPHRRVLIRCSMWISSNCSYSDRELVRPLLHKRIGA